MPTGNQISINWPQFAVCNQNTRMAFEALCRSLFKKKHLPVDAILHANPNNPGIEVEPVCSQIDQKRVSYQSKYFDAAIDYDQIYHSAKKIVEYYVGKIDIVYLYCNKSVTLSSQGYIKAKDLLSENSIALIPVCDGEILDQVLEDAILSSTYFGLPQLTDEWFEQHLEMSTTSLGQRYNDRFNVETQTEAKLNLFLRNDSAAAIINARKQETIESLTRYTCGYEEASTLARKLICEISRIDDIDVTTIDQAKNWSNHLLDRCSCEINSVNIAVEKLKKQRETTTDSKEIYELTNRITVSKSVLESYLDLSLNQDELGLLEAKALIVNGEAGSGKSHLFAHMANKCFLDNQYTVLLLGNSFLSNDIPSQQVLNILDLNCRFDEFLQKLEGLASRSDKPACIFIDAINESANKQIWLNCLSQLIAQLCVYRNIRVAISIRSGYDSILFGDQLTSLRDRGRLVSIHHQGFLDVSIEALQEFMNRYSIPFLPAYALSRELTNPLFLTLFCKYYTGEVVNLSSLFSQIIHQAEREVLSVIGFTEAPSLLSSFLKEFISARLQQDRLSIDSDTIYAFSFWDKFGLSSHKLPILTCLEKSGLISTFISDEQEYYFLSYQRMDDYWCAKHILKLYTNKDHLLDYISQSLIPEEDGCFRNYINEDLVIEICTQYASQYRKELFWDIYERISDSSDRNDMIKKYFLSFSWRTADTLNCELFRKVLESSSLDRSTVCDLLIENSTKINHPLNAEYLHQVLFNLSLNKRDYLWTCHINNLTYEDSRIYQLITYFDKGRNLDGLSPEHIQLLLILFSWLFTSSNRVLRDKASKASIELLKTHFTLCKPLLVRFQGVNDPYVIQRLFGVVFGACMKRNSASATEYNSLAQYIYESYFLQDSIYPDILLRDYARLILERWLYENPENSLSIDPDRIKPPYPSSPIPIVEKQEYTRENCYESGLSIIERSMRINHHECKGMYGDFGRYTFQSALSDFGGIDIVNLYHFAMQYIRDTLGYDDEYLGTEDYRYVRYSSPFGRQHLRERIGKKYQWIALYHILARIADHHILNQYGESTPFEGAWEPYVRDFDPTLNHAFIHSTSIPTLEFPIIDQTDFISAPLAATAEQIDSWVNQKSAFHQELPSHLILEDANHISWVILAFFKSQKIKTEGEHDIIHIGTPYGSQEIWAHAYGCFVDKEQKIPVLDVLTPSIRHHSPQHLPQGLDVYRLFNREYPWSPAVNSVFSEQWESIETETEETYTQQIKLSYNFTNDDAESTDKPSLLEYIVHKKRVVGKVLSAYIRSMWEEQYDASQDECISFNIPCIPLMKTFNLSQHESDGYFYTPTGDLVAYDPSLCGGPDAIVIRKDYLDKFLETHNLDLFWHCHGEKQFFQGGTKQIWSELKSILTYESDAVSGSMEICSVHSSRDD